jgi:hypothetical protein
VRRLEGCLGRLPHQLRLVLELRTGVDVPHPLGPVAVANHLHVSLGRVFRLEQWALRRLRAMARTHACHRAIVTPSGLLSLIGFEPPLGGSESAAVEVKTARYAKSPSRSRSGARAGQSLPGSGALFGIKLPPEAGEVMQIVLLAGGAMLLITFLLTTQLEWAPRFRNWCARRLRRPPS